MSASHNQNYAAEVYMSTQNLNTTYHILDELVNHMQYSSQKTVIVQKAIA